MNAPLNPSKGGSLKWAWRIIDIRRARGQVDEHQIEYALNAIEAVHGRRPIHGSPTYAFDDEERLRVKVGPR
ncbi:hypothetical protein PQR34_28960 [Paraburkholderia sediminicola]|uniref:hypothetical protein n=1 Tax=Paraburkholderia sediminicola TaxID=458836 RepID=UPI0038BB2E17